MMFYISSKIVFKFHLCIIFVLTLLSLLGHAIHLTTGHDYILGMRPLFNMDVEFNVPSIFSALAIFVCSIILLVLHRRYRQFNKCGSAFFLIFCLVFIYLAYDEAMSVHERLTPIMNQWINVSALSNVTWIFPALLFVLFVFLISVKFLCQTDAGSRNLMILSGAIFVSGAVGLEALEGQHLLNTGLTPELAWGRQPNLIYLVLATAEEAAEMLGIALFLYSLIRHYERYFGAFTVCLAVAPLPMWFRRPLSKLPERRCSLSQ